MKSKAKKAKLPQSSQVEFYVCEQHGHDLFQVSEPNHYAVATLGQMANMTAQKPPRFICRKCGTVIQLS